MASFAQNFRTFIGDAALPVFAVQDGNGNIVNISAVSNIIWTAARTTSSAAVLSKSKTGGQIAFYTDGTDGKFVVTITGTDTSVLSGVYVHQAVIIDASGNQTTVTLGQMTVGRAPSWTYDPTQLAASPLMQVRRLIGDVLTGDQQLQDEEINWAISRYSSIFGACADCCRSIASQYARLVDTVQGELRTMYSARTKRYFAMAADFEMRGLRGATPYAGGISNADKNNVAGDSDRAPPSFVRNQFDDLIPESPVGEQTNASSQPDVSNAADFGGVPN